RPGSPPPRRPHRRRAQRRDRGRQQRGDLGGREGDVGHQTLVTIEGGSSLSARLSARARAASCSWFVAKIRHWATLPGKYLRISLSGSSDTEPVAGSKT